MFVWRIIYTILFLLKLLKWAFIICLILLVAALIANHKNKRGK